jgi:hypothetical protein
MTRKNDSNLILGLGVQTALRISIRGVSLKFRELECGVPREAFSVPCKSVDVARKPHMSNLGQYCPSGFYRDIPSSIGK